MLNGKRLRIIGGLTCAGSKLPVFLAALIFAGNLNADSFHSMDALHPDMAGASEPDYEVLANAIYQAEGGPKARKPYGILSVPVKDEQAARRVAINTARNNFKRWMDADKPGTYIEFLANRYTPPSADPKGNANWKANVPAIYAQLMAAQQQPQITEMPKTYMRTVMPNYKL